ncbi:hypothetical protein KUTeg_002638 [Tegillarca granosa]|uniref:Uncharacterized protein n=1 Tax=Tegillarca granosa TaxID=220873 RepID=A0ABQ9FUZ8_TEGGR|nr:hypothetical protein KUTeg_002638 [Tegillarca granosa]
MIILSLPLTCIVLQVLCQNQQEKDTLMYLKAFVAQDNIACNKGGEYCNPEILKCLYKMTFQVQLFESTRINILQSLIRMAINILLHALKIQADILLNNRNIQTDILLKPLNIQTDIPLKYLHMQTDILLNSLNAQTDILLNALNIQTDILLNQLHLQTNTPLNLLNQQKDTHLLLNLQNQCFYDDQCTLGHKCLDYECIPECISDDHCFPGKRCIKYRCECSNNEHCGDGFYCNRRDYRCYESKTKTTPSPPKKQKPKPIKQCPVCEALDHSGRCISVITMVTKYVMTFKQNNVSADQGILETLTESVQEYGIKHQEENQVSISCNVIKEKPRCQM